MMPVMDVRHVRVVVRERLVGVLVRVGLARRVARAVRVAVVLVVDVAVLVGRRLVDVEVRVPLAEEQTEAEGHRPRGRCLAPTERLAEDGDARHRADERGRRDERRPPAGSARRIAVNPSPAPR
jgi:hypothetical protein